MPRSRAFLVSTVAAAFALTLAAILLAPSLAFAADGGSDSGAFQRALARGTPFLLGTCFVTGLVTSLTPCVYPMIVITVSVFGAKEAKSRLQGMLLSATFVLGIVCLFTPMGVAAGWSGSGFGSALGNPWVVALIAIVFSSLAASLFGAFEIALPASLNNRLSSVGGTGYRGAFLLGLVCGLIAAPCAGPLVFGLLTYIGTTRDAVLGSACMALYGLGLGTLFFLVGAFAVSLPKAGAWMMGIKWVGGVVLAYMALAYIRDAMPKKALQAVAHPGTGYVVAGAAALLVGFALAAVHIAAERRRSPIAHLSKPMKLASILPAIAGVFMVFTWNQLPKGDLHWESSEPVAVAKATSEHKPMLVDFGASWCGACKELEEKTFPDPKVRAEGSRFVALHVDATDDDDQEVLKVREKYRATAALPVVVLLDSKGMEAMRFTEFVPPDRFAAALSQVQ